MSAEQLGEIINRAAEDEDFLTLLVEKPDQALQGYALTYEETQLLQAIPATTQITEIIRRAAEDEGFRTLLMRTPTQALQGYELTREETQLLQAVTPSHTQAVVPHHTDQYSNSLYDPTKEVTGISYDDQSFGMAYPADKTTTEITAVSQPTQDIRSGEPPPYNGITDPSEEDVVDAQGRRYFQADPEPKDRRRSLAFVLVGLLAILLACSLVYLISSNINTGVTATETPTAQPAIFTSTPDPATLTPTPTPTTTPTPTPSPTSTDTPTATEPSGYQPRQSCTAVYGDGICCTAAGETSASSCDCEHGGVAFTGDICVCPGIIDKVVICTDGTKYDNPTNQACTPNEVCGGGPPPQQPPPGPGPTTPAPDCSAYGQVCNLTPAFGACPAGYFCGPPYDEFEYGTCQKAGCP